MDNLTLAKYLTQIMRRQEIVIEQLGSICEAIANKEGLATEEGECEIDES